MTWLMNIIGIPLGYVMWASYEITHNYWLSIIIFTILMRFLMIPMSIKQHKNSMHMQLLRPQIDAINKKYGNNREKAQEETTKLYEKEGYNPLNGCSTLFLQLPIIYGLIDVVYRPMTHLLHMKDEVITSVQKIIEAVSTQNGIENIFQTVKGRTMDIQLKILGKLPEYKDYVINGFGDLEGVGAEVYNEMTKIDLNFLGMNLGETPSIAWNLLVLIPIFSLITALASSIISMKMNPQQNEGQGKGCMYAMLLGMPFMSAYFSTVVPAGVGLYWIIGNIVMAVQSVILRKVMTPEKVAEMLQKEKKKGKKKKKSRFMEKFAEAQKQAAAQQGAYSEKEKAESAKKAQAQKEAEKKLTMSDKEKLAEARRRYAEKYGDDIKD